MEEGIPPEVSGPSALDLPAQVGSLAHWLFQSAEQYAESAWKVPSAPWECESELQVRQLRLLLGFLLHDRLACDCNAFLESGHIPELISEHFRATISSAPDKWPEGGVRAGAWGMRYMDYAKGVFLVNSSAPIDQAGAVEIVAGSNGWFRTLKNTGAESVKFDSDRADMWWGGCHSAVFPSAPQGTQPCSIGRHDRPQGELTASLTELWHTACTSPQLATGRYCLSDNWTIEFEENGEVVISLHDGRAQSKNRLRLRRDGRAQILNCGSDAAYAW